MKNKTQTIANIALLFAAAIWGGGFVVMKSTLDSISTNYILAFRFSVGAIGLSYTLIKYHKQLNLKMLLYGFITGLLLYGGFVTQTLGLTTTTASKNAMITASYVIIVPFILLIMGKGKVGLKEIISALICFAGIVILSFENDLSIGTGDILTIISGIVYALHIVVVGIFTDKDINVMLMTCLQFVFAAMFAWIGALSFESFPTTFTGDVWVSLAYICVGCTLLALTIQNVGIKYSESAYASLFMSSESLFGCIFGVVFLGDKLNMKLIAGCLAIIFALILSQIKFSKREKDNKLKE